MFCRNNTIKNAGVYKILYIPVSMQATMEKFNKRTHDDYSTNGDAYASPKQVQTLKKTKRSFWLPNSMQNTEHDVVVVKNWEGKRFPSLKERGSKEGKRDSVLVQTPTMNVQYAWIGREGDLVNDNFSKGNKDPDNAKCSLSLNTNIHPDVLKKAPHYQAEADTFFEAFKDKIDEMYEAGWNDPECWKDHKKSAEKTAKSKKESRDAKTIFMANAECSWLKDVDRNDESKGQMLVFKTALVRNFRVKDAEGNFTGAKEQQSNRPQIWKKMSTGAAKDISNDLVGDKGKYRPGLYTGSSVRVGFELIAWENPSKYGIRAELGPHVLVIREMKKSGGKSSEQILSDVVTFSDDESDEDE